jgi:hypothetical protein
MDGLARDRIALLHVFLLAIVSPFLYDLWSWLGG